MSPAEVNYFLNLEVQQFFRLDVYGWNMCKNKYIYICGYKPLYTHAIHVQYIYLHLLDFSGKCK